MSRPTVPGLLIYLLPCLYPTRSANIFSLPVRAEDALDPKAAIPSDECYPAIYNADTTGGGGGGPDGRVDVEEYVEMINALTNDAYPCGFDRLPLFLQSNWITVSCLCTGDACCQGANAHINTSGTAPRDRPTSSEEDYLTEVCANTGNAIQLASAFQCTATPAPVASPTEAPTSASPSAGRSANPSPAPSLSQKPSLIPSEGPTSMSSGAPTTTPSLAPSGKPSSGPTPLLTGGPTTTPSSAPSRIPTRTPSSGPTDLPTGAPTPPPTTSTPSSVPTISPSTPSSGPTISLSPTGLLDGCPKSLASPLSSEQTISYGLIFHVRTSTRHPILISSLSILISDGVGDFSVLPYRAYSRAASDVFLDRIFNLETDWTLVGSGDVTSTEGGTFIPMEEFTSPVIVPGNGAVQTFYLTLEIQGLVYGSGTPGGTTAPHVQDGFVELIQGTGVLSSDPGTAANFYSDDRTFVGEVSYDVVGPPCNSNSPTIAPSTITQTPTISPTNSSTTVSPTTGPTNVTTTIAPTTVPTPIPTTMKPSSPNPTTGPTKTSSPTVGSTSSPSSSTTSAPSNSPAPTDAPTLPPSSLTSAPSRSSAAPTVGPTVPPSTSTSVPTAPPTHGPTSRTLAPSSSPSGSTTVSLVPTRTTPGPSASPTDGTPSSSSPTLSTAPTTTPPPSGISSPPSALPTSSRVLTSSPSSSSNLTLAPPTESKPPTITPSLNPTSTLSTTSPTPNPSRAPTNIFSGDLVVGISFIISNTRNLDAYDIVGDDSIVENIRLALDRLADETINEFTASVENRLGGGGRRRRRASVMATSVRNPERQTSLRREGRGGGGGLTVPSNAADLIIGRNLLVEYEPNSNKTSGIQIADINCPAIVTTDGARCQEVNANITVSVTDEIRQNVTEDVREKMDRAIDLGGLLRELKEVNPNTDLNVVTSSSGSSPTPAPASPKDDSDNDDGGGGLPTAAYVAIGMGGVGAIGAFGVFFTRKRSLPSPRDLMPTKKASSRSDNMELLSTRSGLVSASSMRGGFDDEDDKSDRFGSILPPEDEKDGQDSDSKSAEVTSAEMTTDSATRGDTDEERSIDDDEHDYDVSVEGSSAAGSSGWSTGGESSLRSSLDRSQADNDSGLLFRQGSVQRVAPQSQDSGNDAAAIAAGVGAGAAVGGAAAAAAANRRKSSRKGSSADLPPLENSGSLESDTSDVRTDLEKAIAAQDWATVGAAASKLSKQREEYFHGSTSMSLSSVFEIETLSRGDGGVDELEDMVDRGDWDGVVKAAATLEAAANQDRDRASNVVTPSVDGTDESENNTHFSNDDSQYSSSYESSGYSAAAEEAQKRAEVRAEVEALVRVVVPEEIDNVSVMMLQFKGREDELITTLQTMQQRSVVQRARASVHKSAKRAARQDETSGSSSTVNTADSASLSSLLSMPRMNPPPSGSVTGAAVGGRADAPELPSPVAQSFRSLSEFSDPNFSQRALKSSVTSKGPPERKGPPESASSSKKKPPPSNVHSADESGGDSLSLGDLGDSGTSSLSPGK